MALSVNLKARLKAGLANFDDSRIEFAVALSMAVFGLWLINPWTDPFTYNIGAYAFMAQAAPKWAWGSVFLMFGLVSLAGLWACSIWTRRIGTTLVFFGRIFLLVSIGVQANWQPTVVPDHAVWAFLTAWAYLRHLR